MPMPDKLTHSDSPLTHSHERAQAGQILRSSFLALLALTAFFIGLIALGIFAPKPYGGLIAVSRPGLSKLTGRDVVFLPVESGAYPSLARKPYSIRLNAAYREGEQDSGFGLALGDKGHEFVVAVSPLGYVSVWETNGDLPVIEHLPWLTWPHVKSGTAQNEIWLDVAPTENGSLVTARVNRELLWRGETDTFAPAAGLWLGSFGGPVSVDFNQVEWFAKDYPEGY